MSNKSRSFEEQPRKVHLYLDQKGAKMKHSGKPFANTLCKMNSNVPGTHITTIPTEVTCKLCRQHNWFKHILNAQYGKLLPHQAEAFEYDYVVSPKQAERIAKHTFEQVILRPSSINGMETRYRRTWTGKLVLQVKERKPYNYDPATDLAPGGYTGVWRDANLSDLGLGVK